MAAGYPLVINEVHVKSSEALYQACRFPFYGEIQQEIISQKSPMTAKMKSKKYRVNTRKDWELVNIRIMQWSLRVKLMQNYNKFSSLLLKTGDLPIVEYSTKDKFWGAMPSSNGELVGANVLGRLLMQLRDNVRLFAEEHPMVLPPPVVNDFLLYGSPIGYVHYHAGSNSESSVQTKLF